MGFPTNNFPQTPPLGSNGFTPALIADKVLSYPSQNGLPASGPGGVASLTTVNVTVNGAQVPTPCSAALELQSTTGAFVMPRMTSAQRLALIATNGMEVYEINTAAVWWFLNNAWVKVNTGGGGGGDVSGPGSSTINAIAIWEVTTGNRIGDSKVLLNLNAFDDTTDDLSHVGSIYASKAADSGGAAPNYSFFGDSGTGMWSSADNTLDFSGAGKTQFRTTGDDTAVNFLTAIGAADAIHAVLTAQGTSGNIDIGIVTKGTGVLYVSSGSNAQAGNIRLLEASTNGSNYVGLRALATLGASYTLTLPPAVPGSANVPLVGDTSGNLTFSAVDLDNVVVGPASATDDAIVIFDGTTGKLVQNSLVTVDESTGSLTMLNAGGRFIAGSTSTAAAPAFTFSGDPNSGIYRIIDEHIGFTANGELQFVIQDGAGSVINTLFVQGGEINVDPSFGINTTTDANVDIAFAAKGTGGLLINPTSGTASPGILKIADTNASNFAAFSVPADVTATYTMILPSTYVGSANGQALTITSGGGTNALTLGFSNTSDIQFLVFNLTAANIIAMHDTPVVIITAQGANTVIRVQKIDAEFVWNSVQFTGGGNFGAQYGHTAALAGPAATSEAASSILTGSTASQIFGMGGNITQFTLAQVANQDICMSNLGADFAAGNSTVTLYITYQVITTT